MAVVCRYGTAGTDPFLEGSARITDPATLRDLTAILGRVAPSPLFRGGGAVSCPFDSGAHDVVLFTGRPSQRIRVTVAESGCRVLSNGTLIGALTPDTERVVLVRVLHRLAPAAEHTVG